MKLFRYQALSLDGTKVQGSIEAIDEYIAMEQIKETYPIVVELREEKEKQGILSMEIGKPKIDAKNLSVMCSQFAIILRSGVPIDTCMTLISKQMKDKNLKKMLDKSAQDVSRGNGIAASFEKHCPFLPITFIETVRAGEESGTLEQSFASLQEYFDKTFKTKQKVKQAMSYPLFVLVVAIAVLIVVMAFVVPTLAQAFIDLDGEMPLMTKLLVDTSEFMKKNIIWIVLTIIGFITAGRFYCRSEKGKMQWNQVKLKIPVLGNIAVLSGAGQFSHTMATLLRSGMSVSNALQITGRVLDNYAMGQEISSMTEGVEEGRRLGDCMRQSKCFPTTLIEMCSIGEETGELEQTLETIGAYFDNEAKYATEKAIQKLEPTIMIVMALFAGFIVIAIYLPMFTMYDLM